MKLFLRPLLRNELIKLFHRRSCRVMALLMLIVAIGTPLLFKLTYVINDRHNDTTEEYYQIMYNQEEGAMKEMYQAILDDIALMKNDGIDINGWRGAYFEYYLRYANTLNALEMIERGYEPDEVTSGMRGLPLIQKDPRDGKIKFWHIIEEHGLDGYYADDVLFRKEDIPKYREEVQVYYDKAKQLLYSGKAEFADLKAAEYYGKIAAAQAQIKTLSGSESDIWERETAELTIVVYEGAIKCWKAFKTCDEENEGWITKLDETLLKMAQFGADDAAAFDKEYFFDENSREYNFYREVYIDKTLSFDSYEKYTEFMTEAKEDFKRAVDMIVFSAENQAPASPSFNSTFRSAKYVLDMSLNAGLYTVMFCCIFLAAVIMGSEYSTGAIRLLLVRPQPRWKILLSKLMALCIFIAISLTAVYTVTALATTLLYGVGDLDTKITVFKYGKIMAVSPLQNAIHKGFLGAISMFGISMLTFMLSLVIKKGAISAAVGAMVFGFGETVAEFTRTVLYKVPFLKYTLFPYIMNLEYAEYDPLDRFLMSLDYTPVSAEYGMELSTGIAVIMLFTAVILMLSFAIFDKQQIKN